MKEDQILDGEFNKTNVPKAFIRWQWHFKHAGMVIGLYLIVMLCLQYILPLLPRVLEDLLNIPLGVLMIFGTCLITGYVCRIGYQWSWPTTLIGGSFMFFSCFLFTMNNLKYWIKISSDRLQIWTSIPEDQLKDILEILVVGVVYSFSVIVLTEILVLLGALFLMLYRLIKKTLAKD